MISLSIKVSRMSRTHSSVLRMYVFTYDSKINIVIYGNIYMYCDLNLSVNLWTGIGLNPYMFCMSI